LSDALLFGGTFEFNTGVPSVRRSAGTHRIATFMRKYGYDVEVFDFLMSWSLDELKSLVKSRVNDDTEVIGFGGTFNINFPIVCEFVDWIKENYPNIKTVAGSQSFQTIHQLNVDYHVVGFAEKAMIEILRGTVKYVERPWNEEGDNRRVIEALHEYPSFPMDDLSIEYEERDFLDPNESLTMECARGCIFKCKFCTFPILGVRDDHTRSAVDFEKNLKTNFDLWGITKYSIADETFNDYTEKVIKYANVVEKLDFEPHFHGYIRADLLAARPDDIEHLARMRYNGHFYGIESFNHASAKSIGKGMEPEKLKETILYTKEYMKKHTGFYKGLISLIIGLPHDTEETIDNTWSWIKNNWQGESLTINPLFIPREGTTINTSVFSRDYKNYGYTDNTWDNIFIENDERIESLYGDDTISTEIKNYIRMLTTGVANDYFSIPWENDAYNAWEAIVKVCHMYADNHWQFGPNPYKFYEWFVAGYSLNDMMQSFEEIGSFSPSLDILDKFIYDYKIKKLEL